MLAVLQFWPPSSLQNSCARACVTKRNTSGATDKSSNTKIRSRSRIARFASVPACRHAARTHAHRRAKHCKQSKETPPQNSATHQLASALRFATWFRFCCGQRGQRRSACPSPRCVCVCVAGGCLATAWRVSLWCWCAWAPRRDAMTPRTVWSRWMAGVPIGPDDDWRVWAERGA